jgi:trans-aconitate 2-methyltransferase
MERKGVDAVVSWNPAVYERFSDHRARPPADLLARVGASDPALVLDLGCGNGPLTLMAAARWPQARVVGVDSSPQMLARARERDPDGRVEWLLADVTEWAICSSGRPDVLLSNALLHWVPAHRRLIPRWCRQLRSGAWFAMQVPGNGTAPSHRLIAQVAAEHPRRAELLPLLPEDPVDEPERYAGLLAQTCAHVDVWETTYLQILDPAGARPSPVLDWVRGTALRPLLDALPAGEQGPFLDDLGRRLAAAYPRRDYGVPFPFRRIFAVGRIR